MPYIGSTPTTQSFISGTDYFNGTGSQTAFTLTRTVASVNDIQAVVNNVVQVPNDAYTISGTTITFTSAPSAGTQNVYVRYLSTTTQAISPSQGTVGWNQLNSDTQQDLGISFKNRIINGAMAVFQRGTAATADAVYSVDRWRLVKSNDATESASQNTDAPVGFSYSLRNTISTGDGTIGAAQYSGFEQSIEGFNINDLNWGTVNAKTVTLSFWIRSSVTGQYTGNLRNADDSRIYPFNFTINSANTWEFESITITPPTDGTWNSSNGIGIKVAIYAALGSNFLGGTANAWNSTSKYGSGSPVNGIASNGNIFAITGVQLEIGTQATTFTTAGGSYGAELALCQRYLPAFKATATSGILGVGQAYNTTDAILTIPFPVVARTHPTGIVISSSSHFNCWLSNTGLANPTTISFNQATPFSGTITATGGSGLVAGNSTSVFFNNASGNLYFTGCEL